MNTINFYSNFFSYTNHSLQKHMESKKIRTDNSQFNLLQKMLTMDPLKRISALEAMEHPYFKEDPVPTADVFAGQKIPYEKREFLNDDAEEKNSNKLNHHMIMHNGMQQNNMGQQVQHPQSTLEPPQKRLKIGGKVRFFIFPKLNGYSLIISIFRISLLLNTINVSNLKCHSVTPSRCRVIQLLLLLIMPMQLNISNNLR